MPEQGSTVGGSNFSLFGHDLFGEKVQGGTGPLSQRFGISPFSVLRAGDGEWLTRKRAWGRTGIDSVLGRDAEYVKNEVAIHRGVQGDITAGTAPELAERFAKAGTGMSIFDPVLAELAYRWWSPAGGTVLDPFAGGSVRGIVAALLGRRYVGVDLRSEQVLENEGQWREIGPRHSYAVRPLWLEGDAAALGQVAALPVSLPLDGADMVFTCPPYFDLEVYSDDPRDLSNVSWPAFVDLYRCAIGQAVACLAPNRFSVWVVGDVRDSRGMLRGLPALTVAAHQEAGAAFYNDGVLVTPAGTLPVRTSFQFNAGRKLGRCHQHVLVFVKGDPKLAAAACEPHDATTPPGLVKVNRAAEALAPPPPPPPPPVETASEDREAPSEDGPPPPDPRQVGFGW